MKAYVCRRLRLFTYLTEKGFFPYQMRADKHNSKFNVWLFIDTPELREVIEEYYSTLPVNNK